MNPPPDTAGEGRPGHVVAHSTELTIQPPTEQPRPVSVVRASERGVQFSTLGEIGKFAAVAVNSGIYKDLPSPEVAIIKIQAGLELGLTPVWALTNIMVVNGRPSVWGDALMGIVRGHPACEDVIETSTGEGESLVAICTVKRRGCEPVTRKFSMAEAKRAGLTGKGPWLSFPARMLQMRARSFACRDAFADALRGIGVAEEMQDIPKANVREVAPVPAIAFADDPPPDPNAPADHDLPWGETK